MDSSVTRRGQPCWYRLEEVGLIAVNDGLLLESLMYIIIKSHFRGEKYTSKRIEIGLPPPLS
jgi:farnesyl diphosphate synthase